LDVILLECRLVFVLHTVTLIRRQFLESCRRRFIGPRSRTLCAVTPTRYHTNHIVL